MRRQTRSMSSSPYSKSVSIEKSSNMRRETRSMGLSPHSTTVLVEKSIDEQNMQRQNRSDRVKVLESQKDIVGQFDKKKSKRIIMDVDQGKRKCVVEDEVNLGVKPKKSKVEKAEKVKITDKVCKTWKLYIPVGEPFPVTHWSSYTNVDIILVLQSKLTDVHLRMFRESCFGYFLDLPRVAIQAQLIRSLIIRELVQDKCD
uniref:Uncharacterized protein LOC104212923 n=1 Tax=Nicotiana sylvestris TaxID=4096 RepID=A0A1U7UX35_NICSY|nr:PREDICTED: uncharacterized protein LOC104212923 [Nicotiana sylvestris]